MYVYVVCTSVADSAMKSTGMLHISTAEYAAHHYRIFGTAETIDPQLSECFKSLNVNNPTASKKTDGPLNYIDKKPMDLDINGI